MCRRFNQDASTLRKTHEKTLAELRRTAIAPPHGNIDADTQSISLFILGASRAGKSTLEKLLSTLDGVKRGHENPIVDHAVRRTFQSAGLLASNRFAELPPALDSQCRRFYFEELARRAGTATVFTNTHPMRINDVARIAAAFPDVRFVCLKRNLEDNMFRIYLRKYGSSGHEYAYDLETIRDHLLWYDKMIDLIAEQLPNITRVIHYEDMVADPAGARRSVAELCGLPSSGGPLPEIGDDRRCARPYRRYMTLDQQG